MIYEFSNEQRYRGGRYLTVRRMISLDGNGTFYMRIYAGNIRTLVPNDAYQEDTRNEIVLINNLTFRELVEFKLARAKGMFKEIGVE